MTDFVRGCHPICQNERGCLYPSVSIGKSKEWFSIMRIGNGEGETIVQAPGERKIDLVASEDGTDSIFRLAIQTGALLDE